MTRRRLGARAVTITSLAGSRSDDIRHRERRYVQVMLFRLAAFIASVVLFHGWARFAAVVLALILPWVAVVFANQPVDRKPSPTLLKPQEPSAPSLQAAREHRVIDQD